ASGSFAAMGDEGDESSDECCEQLMLWRELAGGAVGQESGHGDSDEGVKGIPDQIESGDLVGEELDREQCGASRNYGPALQYLQTRGKRKMAEACQKSQNTYGGVEVQAGSEADGDKKREQLSRRDIEDIEHQLGVRPWVLGVDAITPPTR